MVRIGKSAKYVTKLAMEKIIDNMYPENALVMKIALQTGIRITDVLNLRIGDVRQNKKIRIVEGKTGKNKTVYIPAKLRSEILATRTIGTHDGYYVFPARVYWQTKHRSRQAVYKDMMRAIEVSGVNVHCSPHSARKIYAVDEREKGKTLDEVKALLNHRYESSTLLYMLSDYLAGYKR